jgi:hypothetical protein
VSLLLAGIAVAAALAACSGGGAAKGSPPPASLVELLADRRLVEVSPARGAVERRRRVGRRTPVAGATGSYLAATRDRLFALVPAAAGAPQVVRSFTARGLRPVRRYRLPPGIVFRSLQASRDGSRLYAAGNRGTAAHVGAPVVVAIDAGSGRVVGTRAVRPAAGRSRLVLDTALSHDGALLLVSYHGPDTTGADWVPLRDPGRRCVDRTPPSVACLTLHGGVAFRGRDVVATTGEGPLVERTLGDRLVRSWPPKLPRNHLMRFALYANDGRAAVLGGCDYAGGLSVISLGDGATRVLGYPGKICGEQVVAVDARTLVIARNPLSVPQGGPSELDVVDVGERKVVRRIAIPSDVVDAAVLEPGAG